MGKQIIKITKIKGPPIKKNGLVQRKSVNEKNFTTNKS